VSPTPPRVLVSTTIHDRPDLFEAQRRNYDWALGGAAMHLVHVARKGREAVLAGLASGPLVLVNPRVAETVHSNNFLGHVANFRQAVAEGIPFDTFLLHTGNDLICRPGLAAAMAGSDLGFGRCWPINPAKEYWQDRLEADPRLAAHSRRHGVEGPVLKAHTDGAFFPRAFFAELLEEVFGAMPEEALGPAATPYPPQEFWLPCAVQTLVARHGLRCGRNAILVLERSRGQGAPVTPEEVLAVHAGRAAEVAKTYRPEEVFGLKYFSRDPADPARVTLAGLMAG
jgi:hypothetical protein